MKWIALNETVIKALTGTVPYASANAIFLAPQTRAAPFQGGCSGGHASSCYVGQGHALHGSQHVLA